MKKTLIILFGLMIFITSTVYSQVGECPPSVTHFTFTYVKPVVKDQKIGGATVCDPDVGQTETWSIDDNPPLWKISDGNILVNDAAAINSSTTKTYVIVIRVTDNGVPPLSSTATVTMNEINNSPIISNQIFSVNENSVNGTIVGTVIATDIDVVQTKTFSIVSGNSNGAFSINSTTGVLVVSNTSVLDFETTPTFSLIVKVQDNATTPLSGQATITINLVNVNEAPIILNQTYQ